MYTINFHTALPNVCMFLHVEELSKNVVKVQLEVARPKRSSYETFLPMRRKSLDHLTSFLKEKAPTITSDYKLRDVLARAVRFHTPIECRQGIAAMSMQEIQRDCMGHVE